MHIKHYKPSTKTANNNMLKSSKLQPPIVRSVQEIFNRCYMQPELLSDDVYDSDFDNTEDLENTPIEYADKFDMVDKLRQPFEPQYVKQSENSEEPNLESVTETKKVSGKSKKVASEEPSEPTE